MSKRIVELTCGDPKTNQQTASKVECVINVNNHQSAKPAPKPQETEAEDVEVFVEETVDGVKTEKRAAGKREAPVQSLFVAREVIAEEFARPAVAEGYIQTAVRPTICESEILASITVKDVLLQGFANLLTTNDVALISQLRAACQSEDRRIVLMLPDLKKLIAAVIRLVEPEFSEDSIKVKVLANDFEIGCCGMKKKTLVRPFNEITSIAVGNQELKIHQFEAYNVIEEKLGVSLQYVYSAVPDKEINEEQPCP
jgi:hypothetical protein